MKEIQEMYENYDVDGLVEAAKNALNEGDVEKAGFIALALTYLDYEAAAKVINNMIDKWNESEYLAYAIMQFHDYKHIPKTEFEEWLEDYCHNEDEEEEELEEDL